MYIVYAKISTLLWYTDKFTQIYVYIVYLGSLSLEWRLRITMKKPLYLDIRFDKSSQYNKVWWMHVYPNTTRYYQTQPTSEIPYLAYVGMCYSLFGSLLVSFKRPTIEHHQRHIWFVSSSYAMPAAWFPSIVPRIYRAWSTSHRLLLCQNRLTLDKCAWLETMLL